MAKGNILKEAIADAKAVREVALANAKSALEEAFTPKLQNMLSARLSEELDETYYDEDEKDMDEMMSYDEDEKDMDEGHMDGHGMYDEDEKDSMDEEIDLEEILNELELEEGKKADDEEVVDEAKKAEDDDEKVEETVGYPNYRADQVQKVKADATDVNQGLNESDNKEFDLDSLLKEINDLEETTKEVEEQAMAPTTMARKNPRVAKRGVKRGSSPTKLKHGRVNNPNANMNPQKPRRVGMKPKMSRPMMEVGCLSAKKELEELKKVLEVKTLELNEVNLLNSKLLYVNRIFKANQLDEGQKLRVVETLDKADSTKEAKLIYETIKDTFKVANTKKESKNIKTKKTIKESFKGMASKAAGMSRTKKTAPKKAIISESDNMVNRFQKLANININE